MDVFGHFLVPFGLPKWSQKCSKIGVKNHPGPQRAPRELPRVPKEPPRPPKVSKSPPPGTLRGSILVHLGSILDPSATFLAPLSAILVFCVSGLGCRVRGTLHDFSWLGLSSKSMCIRTLHLQHHPHHRHRRRRRQILVFGVSGLGCRVRGTLQFFS